jgi:hypothetical protein
MSTELDDLPTLAAFRDQLVAVARAEARPAPKRARRSRVTVALAALLATALAATAAAATFAGLRATVIPGPSASDVAPEMVVRSGSTHVLTNLRVADPAGGTVWTLRAARVRDGEQCLTVGQTQGGTFGLVGLDGRFRALAPAFVDGCGTPQRDRAGILGARIFAAATRGAVRTAVYGQANTGLRSVTLAVAGTPRPRPRPRAVAVRAGAFLAVVPGYPEDRPLTVTLTFADGHRQVRVFGTSPRLATDPFGGPALRLSGFVIDSAPHTSCLQVLAARDASGRASGPALCGDERSPQVYGGVRRLTPGRHGSIAAGGYDWGRFPARTLAWGAMPQTGPRVTRVSATAAGHRYPGRVLNGRSFLVTLPARVPPDSVRVTVATADGATMTLHGSAHLVANPATR